MKRKNSKVTIDDTTFTLVELSFGEVRGMKKLDEEGQVAQSLYLGTYVESHGEQKRAFENADAVYDLPLSVLKQLTEELGKLNNFDPKK